MTSLPSTAQIDKARNMSEQIDYYLPVHRFGRKIGEVLIRIHPKWDEALGGLTVDIDAEDADNDMFRLSDAEAREVLDEIKRYDPDEFDRITETAKERDIEGCDPVSYEPHYAEDELATLECPR